MPAASLSLHPSCFYNFHRLSICIPVFKSINLLFPDKCSFLFFGDGGGGLDHEESVLSQLVSPHNQLCQVTDARAHNVAYFILIQTSWNLDARHSILRWIQVPLFHFLLFEWTLRFPVYLHGISNIDFNLALRYTFFGVKWYDLNLRPKTQ